MSGGTPGASGGPGRPGGKRGAVALQLKLPCASLDDVKARYPELQRRLFPLRLKQPLPIDTMVRLEARLSTGAACFSALAIVERAVPKGNEPAVMTLAIIAMDEPGRELVAWMGGKPPKALRSVAEPPPAPAPPPAGGLGPFPALGPAPQLGPLPTFQPPPPRPPAVAPPPPAVAPPPPAVAPPPPPPAPPPPCCALT